MHQIITADMATADISLPLPPTTIQTQRVSEEQGHEHDHPHHDHDDHDHPLRWVDLVRIGLVALAVVASWFRLWQPFANFDVIALAARVTTGPLWFSCSRISMRA
jgi:hypothetical protein